MLPNDLPILDNQLGQNNQIRNIDGLDDKDGFYITKVISGTYAQHAENYGFIFIAQSACEVVLVAEVHGVANVDTLTLDIEKLTGTTAKGSGTSILLAQFNLKGTANTVVSKNYKALTARTLNAGDRLALKPSGSYNGLEDVCITLYLKPLGKGHYR